MEKKTTVSRKTRTRIANKNNNLIKQCVFLSAFNLAPVPFENKQMKATRTTRKKYLSKGFIENNFIAEEVIDLTQDDINTKRVQKYSDPKGVSSSSGNLFMSSNSYNLLGLKLSSELTIVPEVNVPLMESVDNPLDFIEIEINDDNYLDPNQIIDLDLESDIIDLDDEIEDYLEIDGRVVADLAAVADNDIFPDYINTPSVPSTSKNTCDNVILVNKEIKSSLKDDISKHIVQNSNAKIDIRRSSRNKRDFKKVHVDNNTDNLFLNKTCVNIVNNEENFHQMKSETSFTTKKNDIISCSKSLDTNKNDNTSSKPLDIATAEIVPNSSIESDQKIILKIHFKRNKAIKGRKNITDEIQTKEKRINKLKRNMQDLTSFQPRISLRKKKISARALLNIDSLSKKHDATKEEKKPFIRKSTVQKEEIVGNEVPTKEKRITRSKSQINSQSTILNKLDTEIKENNQEVTKSKEKTNKSNDELTNVNKSRKPTLKDSMECKDLTIKNESIKPTKLSLTQKHKSHIDPQRTILNKLDSEVKENTKEATKSKEITNRNNDELTNVNKSLKPTLKGGSMECKDPTIKSIKPTKLSLKKEDNPQYSHILNKLVDTEIKEILIGEKTKKNNNELTNVNKSRKPNLKDSTKCRDINIKNENIKSNKVSLKNEDNQRDSQSNILNKLDSEIKEKTQGVTILAEENTNKNNDELTNVASKSKQTLNENLIECRDVFIKTENIKPNKVSLKEDNPQDKRTTRSAIINEIMEKVGLSVGIDLKPAKELTNNTELIVYNKVLRSGIKSWTNELLNKDIVCQLGEMLQEEKGKVISNQQGSIKIKPEIDVYTFTDEDKINVTKFSSPKKFKSMEENKIRVRSPNKLIQPSINKRKRRSFTHKKLKSRKISKRKKVGKIRQKSPKRLIVRRKRFGKNKIVQEKEAEELRKEILTKQIYEILDVNPIKSDDIQSISKVKNGDNIKKEVISDIVSNVLKKSTKKRESNKVKMANIRKEVLKKQLILNSSTSKNKELNTPATKKDKNTLCISTARITRNSSMHDQLFCKTTKEAEDIILAMSKRRKRKNVDNEEKVTLLRGPTKALKVQVPLNNRKRLMKNRTNPLRNNRIEGIAPKSTNEMSINEKEKTVTKRKRKLVKKLLTITEDVQIDNSQKPDKTVRRTKNSLSNAQDKENVKNDLEQSSRNSKHDDQDIVVVEVPPKTVDLTQESEEIEPGRNEVSVKLERRNSGLFPPLETKSSAEPFWFSPVQSNDVKFGSEYRRVHRCKICLQSFASYVQLKKHKVVHELKMENPYQCKACHLSCINIEDLTSHLRLHQGKMPYQCKKCEEGFWTTNQLEKHELVHVLKKTPPPPTPPKKLYTCEVCFKAFKKICDLERHIRVHTGEKPSKCNICNKSFQQSYNLSKHLLTHTQEKQYECVICGKKFGRPDILNRHVLTHSVDKPFHCKVCPKMFIRGSQLNLHMKNRHPEVNFEPLKNVS